jgi:hypothetical protein
MAVVINEFEVVPEALPQNQAAVASPAAPASSGPTVHELRQMILKMEERVARIRAH